MLKNETTGPLNEKQKEIVYLSTDAIEAMKKTIEDLLEAAKIEEGKSEYNFQSAQIENIIEEIIPMYIPKCLEKNIKILFTKSTTPLPPLTVDKDKLKVVLGNILDNGIKYNVLNGEIRININKIPDKPYLQINIQDTGMGIPSKDLPHMFTKFFRSDNVVKQETRGTGLGLHIVKNIVENHGGQI
jgi:signal transduction histidine kinase